MRPSHGGRGFLRVHTRVRVFHESDKGSILADPALTSWRASFEHDPVSGERLFERLDGLVARVCVTALEAPHGLDRDPTLAGELRSIPTEQLSRGDAVLRPEVPHKATIYEIARERQNGTLRAFSRQA